MTHHYFRVPGGKVYATDDAILFRKDFPEAISIPPSEGMNARATYKFYH